MRVASLHVYPVKGARGIALDHAEVLPSGIRHDRRFMVVGEDGTFVTQRSHPRLALVDVALDDGTLTLSAAGRIATIAPDELEVRPADRRARVWDDEVDAVDAGRDAAELLSEHLGLRCSLVFMPSTVVRPVEAPYGRPGDHVGFADAYPVLVASIASLDELNARLEAKGASPVPMNRFRPNVVVEGGVAFAEDEAALARIGELVLRMPKRCSRCQVTTVDQLTGVAGKEPLRTLATYRSQGKKVMFAMNAIPELAQDRTANVSVGDPVLFAPA